MHNPHMHPTDRKKELLYNNRIWIAASSAAICGVVAGYPFDSIKTRMQTYQYSSLWSCLKDTIKEEGFAGLYRVNQNSLTYITFSSTIAGGISGSAIATFTCPLELVKIQMQLSELINKERLKTIDVLKAEIFKMQNVTSSSYQKRLASLRNLENIVELSKNTNPEQSSRFRNLNSIKSIIRSHGPLGLYSGISINLLRDFLGSGIYFGTYETSKLLLKRVMKSNDSSPITHMIAGGICGVFAWIVIFPIDLIKSQYQKNLLAYPGNKQNYFECLRRIYASGGLKGFYRGISVTLIRAFPLHALNFTIYEY
ncbi:hypothetical protein BB560_004643, partial [Smittium megazygosporum]